MPQWVDSVSGSAMLSVALSARVGHAQGALGADVNGDDPFFFDPLLQEANAVANTNTTMPTYARRTTRSNHGFVPASRSGSVT